MTDTATMTDAPANRKGLYRSPVPPELGGRAGHGGPDQAGAAPASRLQQRAATLVAQCGAYRFIGSVATSPGESSTIVAVRVTFAQAVTLNVSVNAAGRVIRLHPGSVETASRSAASYIDPGSFTETAVSVASAPLALADTLTIPNGSFLGGGSRHAHERDR